MILEKITNNDIFSSDYNHLLDLLNSKTFEGTPEQRVSLLKELEILRSEFSNISEDVPLEIKKKEWSRKYAPLKFQVYKYFGYTVSNNGL